MNQQHILEQLKQFHGHLGPYAVLGYKIGELANQHLGTNPFAKHATIHTPPKPPQSCLIDGIQLSSGCTTGKANLTIQHTTTPPHITFSNNNGQHLHIHIKPEITSKLDTQLTTKNLTTLAEELYHTPPQKLFIISHDKK